MTTTTDLDDLVALPGGQRSTRGATWACLLLALGATSLSLSVAAMVGWQRGGTLAEQTLLAAVGVMAVLGAHLLLPLCRVLSAVIATRLVGVFLWLACLVYAATSHADFFIEMQAQRAEHRVAAMESSTLSAIPVVKRSLSAILEEQAAVRSKWMQTRSAQGTCEARCESLKIRVIALKDRVTALEAEEEEARRWQVTQDQIQQRRQALRDDPVTSRLERDFGVTPAVSGAVTVLPIAAILEGLGALCWCLALQGRARLVTGVGTGALTIRVTTPVAGQVTQTADGPADASPMTEPLVPVVTTSVELQPDEDAAAGSRHDDAPELRGVQALAAKVWVEIQQGQVRPTVSGIRAHLGIAQQQARAIARLIRCWQAAGTSG